MKARSFGALVLFVVLATANSGGYRYGIGDQAFYQPATALRLHPELFPRDRALIESQAKLTVVDEALAAASRVTRLDLPKLFFILYLVTLAALCVASAELAAFVGLSPLATSLFLLFLTFRHRIAKTGANTLEGYMHPRELSFAVGVFAFTAALKRRWALAAILGLVAMAIHPTTAAWWAVAIASSLILTSSGRQRILLTVTLAAFLVGPIVARSLALPVMDRDWLSVLEGKDYLFASGWPAYAWALNLAYLPLILLAARAKDDGRFVAPALALFAVFVCSYPLTESRVALAVQLQVSRVFWLLDFLLSLLGAWALIDSPWARRSRLLPRVIVGVVLIAAIGRGFYTVHQGGPARRLVEIDLPADDWTETMAWLRTQPSDWLVLASPDHAWLYGASVRVAAGRDVVVEGVKDSAISMYDRGVAMRTAERLRALADYNTMDAARARAIGHRYGAAVAVVDASDPIDLPLLHRNATFAVYDLR